MLYPRHNRFPTSIAFPVRCDRFFNRLSFSNSKPWLKRTQDCWTSVANNIKDSLKKLKDSGSTTPKNWTC